MRVISRWLTTTNTCFHEYNIFLNLGRNLGKLMRPSSNKAVMSRTGSQLNWDFDQEKSCFITRFGLYPRICSRQIGERAGSFWDQPPRIVTAVFHRVEHTQEIYHLAISRNTLFSPCTSAIKCIKNDNIEIIAVTWRQVFQVFHTHNGAQIFKRGPL